MTNPADPSKPPPPPLPKQARQRRQRSDTEMALTVVADVATGPNIRKKDNLYQALFILACLAIAVPTLWIITGHWLGGVLAGGLIGLVVGVLLSGGFLMVFRLFRH